MKEEGGLLLFVTVTFRLAQLFLKVHILTKGTILHRPLSDKEFSAKKQQYLLLLFHIQDVHPKC